MWASTNYLGLCYCLPHSKWSASYFSIPTWKHEILESVEWGWVKCHHVNQSLWPASHVTMCNARHDPWTLLTFLSKDNMNFIANKYRRRVYQQTFFLRKVSLWEWHCAGTMLQWQEQWGGTYWWVEVTLISWRVPSRLFKLLFLQRQCDVSKQDFFNPMKDQNIQKTEKRKKVMMLYSLQDT
jgi:hypothetical protein